MLKKCQTNCGLCRLGHKPTLMLEVMVFNPDTKQYDKRMLVKADSPLGKFMIREQSRI
jgi:hypothetical protein